MRVCHVVKKAESQDDACVRYQQDEISDVDDVCFIEHAGTLPVDEKGLCLLE
jgi:hypothetical protein